MTLEEERRRYAQGRATVLFAGVVMSTSGPLVRLIESATEWQVLAYRSLAIVLVPLAFIAIRDGRGTLETFRRAGATALLAGAFLAVAFTFIIFALINTTIANALFLLSTAPFFTAVIGRVVLKESPSRTTWIAIGVACAGVLVMVGEGVAEGDLLGDLSALGGAATFGCYSVTIRHGRSHDMVPAVIYGGALSGIGATLIALYTGMGLAVSGHDIAVSLAFGAVAIAGGIGLYTLGARNVPAAELNLLSLGEVVLSPIWVWIGFGEIPSPLTLLGGAIVLGAVAAQALAGMRSMAARRGAKPSPPAKSVAPGEAGVE